MGTLNRCMFIGRVGGDPEVKTIGEKRVAQFSLAVSDKWKDSSGIANEATTWVNIVSWGKQADLAHDYIRKGMELFVEGRLRIREYVDANGVKKRVSEIISSNMQLLGNRKAGQTEQAALAHDYIRKGMELFVEGRLRIREYVDANGVKRVAQFSLAVSDKWKDSSGIANEATTWVNIVSWGKQADLVHDYIRKGRELFVEGRLRIREYVDANGVKKRVSEIISSNMQLLGNRKAGQTEQAALAHDYIRKGMELFVEGRLRIREYVDANGVKRVAQFSLAVSDKWKDSSGIANEATTWVNIVSWGKQADLAHDYIRKGMELFVEGRLRIRKYVDANGVKKRVSEIISSNMQLLGNRKAGQTEQAAPAPEQEQEQQPRQPLYLQAQESLEPRKDDLPF